MQKMQCTLTVYFEDPFWVAVYERRSGGRLQACKITFGAEPSDGEVYEFLLTHWNGLCFSPPVKADDKKEAKINPKRRQRLIKKQLAAAGAGTKSQQAIKLQQEENKLCRKSVSRRQKQEEEQRQFALRQQKRKEKHRGR